MKNNKVMYVSFYNHGDIAIRRKNDMKFYCHKSKWINELLKICISNSHVVIHEPYDNIVFWLI